MDKKEILGGFGREVFDLEEELFSEEEIENRARDAELFYKKHFERFLALKELDWLQSMGVKDWTKEPKDHAIWHQGGMAAIQEIRNWFKQQVETSLARFNEEDKPEPGEAVPTI